MNSNTHIACLFEVWNVALCTPCSSITTISPGWTSRTNVARTVSSAQVSDATTCAGCPASGMKPMHSGRKPKGSRSAMSWLAVMMPHEYAPTTRAKARRTTSSHVRPCVCSMSRAITSVSRPDSKTAPSSSS